MFFDIGPLEMIALVILGVLIFGPEKLPKVIQDAMGFIRKVRAFSETAKEDIRKELGPEFKDFEFEDLNPRTFVRKNILENDDLGLSDIKNGFDMKGLTEGLDLSLDDEVPASRGGSSGTSPSGGPDLRKRERLDPGERPPYDVDAT